MVLTEAQKEVIERKRLDALNKRRNKGNPDNNVPTQANVQKLPQAPFIAQSVQPEPNWVSVPAAFPAVPLPVTQNVQSSSSGADVQKIIESKRQAALAKRLNRESSAPQPDSYQPPLCPDLQTISHIQPTINPQPQTYVNPQQKLHNQVPQSDPYQSSNVQPPTDNATVSDQRMNLVEAKRQEALNRLGRSRTIPPIINEQKHNNQIVMNNAVRLSNIEAKRLEALKKLNANKQPITNIQNNDTHHTSLNQLQNTVPAPQQTTCKTAVPQISVKDQIEANRRKALELRANRPTQSNSKDSTESVVSASKDPMLHSGPALVATCCLVSPSRFVLQAKFHSQLIELVKTLASRQYDKAKAQWSVEVAEHDALLTVVKPLQPAVKVTPLPRHILNILKLPKISPSPLGTDSKILKALLPFQRTGVEFVLARQGRALIADDMGLGKTIQALAIMQEYHQDWPLLVICPSSLRLTWAEAFISWLDMEEGDIKVIFKGSDNLEGERVTIISYDLLSKFELKGRFGCVIADESHFLKNSKSVRSKAAEGILQSAKRCILLSGTPALSKPIELFSQLVCVDKRRMPSVQEFGVRYCAGVKNAWGWDFNGHSNLEELNIFMSSHFMIRRLKGDVLDQLPAKRRKKVIIEAKITKSLNVAASVADNASKKDYQASFFEYYRETAQAKVGGVLHYVDELLESEKKFLLFAHHQAMISALKQHFDKQGVQYILIDGKTPGEHRQALCDRFQSNKTCYVALLSITAANTGLTLTSADTVVFAELFWNPGVLQQAEDRVHRIGQKNSVVIHYLVAHKTSDDKMWPMIEAKLSILGNMGVSSGDFKDTSCSHHTAPSDQTDIMSFFETLEPESKRRKI